MVGPQTTLALHLAAPNLPINQVEALLPAAGVAASQRLQPAGRYPHGEPLHHRTSQLRRPSAARCRWTTLGWPGSIFPRRLAD